MFSCDPSIVYASSSLADIIHWGHTKQSAICTSSMTISAPPHHHHHSAFAWASSCLCVAWPRSSRSGQQKPNQRQLSRGTACSNQVRGLFRIGSEIIASRSQEWRWPSPRGLIGSWPSQTQRGPVSGQLRLCRLWLCDSANERGHRESSSSDVSGSMSWQPRRAKWVKQRTQPAGTGLGQDPYIVWHVI